MDERLGGEGDNLYRIIGISYWDEEDGQKLSRDIQEIYQNPGGKERFWEQVPLVYRRDHYRIEIRECSEEDVTEIDTFKELTMVDSAYLR